MVKKILSLILNIVAVVASIIGLIVIRDSGAIVYVKYFTVLTNFMIIISGFISIGYSVDFLLKKDKETTLPPFVYVIKLITATSALLTFLVVVCFLQFQPAPSGLLGATGNLLINNICHHYVAPLAFILGFILFDVERKYNVKLAFLGPILLIIYMAYMGTICIIDSSIVGGAPYIFMDTSKIAIWMIPLFMLGFLVAGFGLSFVLWVLNRICFYIFTGDEISKEEINAIETSSDDKQTEKEIEQEIKEEEKIVEETGYKGPKIYHISKRREDEMWQVKFANGKKAIKLFNTQAEAIVFAKKLAKSQDGSIRVHSLKGRIRKTH